VNHLGWKYEILSGDGLYTYLQIMLKLWVRTKNRDTESVLK